MAYYDLAEHERRIARVREILETRGIDLALVYYDEINLANAWYLTGWCPQFESGVVLVPREGSPLILGGPESEPFARMDSAIRETRNLPVFMVPDEEYPNAVITDFVAVFREVGAVRPVKRAGLVGVDQMPVAVHRQMAEGFHGVEIVDITAEYLRLRYTKSPWELAQLRKVHELVDIGYEAMKVAMRPGAREYEVAAAGEHAVRSRGANGFGFRAIVGSGRRANAVVPTAGDKVMETGETAIIGLSPRWNGYAGVVGDTLAVNGTLTREQTEAREHMREVFRRTKEKLRPGVVGKEIDAPGRAYFRKYGFMKYLVCPFAHTIGLNEAEQPFFGPHSTDELCPGMTVAIDVSFFGHPVLNGMRIETVYEITDRDPVPFSPTMDLLLTG